MDDNDLIWSNYKLHLEEDYKVKSVIFNTKYEKEDLNQLKDTYRNYDVVLVSFFSKILAWKKNIFPDKSLIKLLEEINQSKSVIYITYSNPYLIKKIKFIQDYFCTFSDLPDSQNAIIDTIFKDFNPGGVSPVKL